MPDEFLHKLILKIFPWLKARTLISWSEHGLVKPEFGDASGRGSSRVYSYRNLMQIGIVSEFLRVGVPFAIIREAMHSTEMQAVMTDGRFESVFWFRREMIAADVPMTVEPPWAGEYGVAPFDEFVQKGGALLLDVSSKGKETFIGNTTTAVVINIGSIRRFVDRQIARICP
jgi:hypothetical protein